MSTYDLQRLNELAASAPETLIADACARYHGAIADAAQTIAARVARCPIVLLSGPSSSGKTTTASLLAAQLALRGVRAHRVSMDDYYLDRDSVAYPRLSDGRLDLESPYGIDLPLLYAHMAEIVQGHPVEVPYFDFPTQRRDPTRAQHLDLKPGDAVILEGIHALNTLFTDRQPEATRVYVCADADFTLDGHVVFPKVWIRFLRRAMRDRTYRGCPVAHTLELWENVLAGEAAHIAPYASSAHIRIDTTHAFEPGVLLPYARHSLRTLPPDAQHREMVDAILSMEDRVTPIDPRLVPADSLLRTEFVEV